ncbi:glycoside hydrolase family 108 protein [Burkholderia sp. LMG 21824]|uniref:glycoside hydrolase family 108 protein n=1 Tax=Burkholderia sp. LMG 21824 TaxID=3158172 RepID=UPI003C30AFB7
MDTFDQAFALVVGAEGGFSTDQNDPGNWTGGHVGVGVFKGTKYGISAASYPNLDIANLSVDDAKAIYGTDYWSAACCDQMPWPLALFMFDCAVNQGVGTAKMTLQQALGVVADGVIGPVTLAAAQSADVEHVALFMAQRGIRYTHSPIFPSNGLGWFKRLFVMCLNHGG